MSSFDQEIMARTALGEARGEGEEGMQAVMWTGVNRFTAKRWYSGQTIAGTFLKGEQYDCWDWSDKTNYPLIINITDDIPLVTHALVMAADVMTGRVPDPTMGATHYYADGMSYTPSWAATGEFTVKIGRQNFYKNVP